MTLMTMVRALFWKASFEFWACAFVRCVKKEQNRRPGPLSLPEPGGLLRSRRAGAKNGARRSIRGFQAGGSIAPRRATVPASPVCLAVRIHRDHRFASTFSKFRARAEPMVLTRKTIRTIYRNPSASRPLPSKTDRDTNLEGFFWRCL